jgi:putative aminopeptidase FrvX
MTHKLLIAAATAALLPQAAVADTADRLLQLVSIPGVAGYEAQVREAIEMLLPTGARVRADNLGNIVIRTGNGAPHTLVVAPLDEKGLVVSAITDDGYLRVHRHTARPEPPLAAQYDIGQPILIRTAAGGMVPGVTATASAHLRGFRDPKHEAVIKTIDDIWIDVGAESRAEVEKLAVRLLDSVTLRERATRLAGSRVSGVGAAGRGAALSIVEIIRRSSGKGAAGSVTLAWVTQSEYGNRGLVRLLEAYKPDRVIALRSAPNPGDNPRGAVGELGGGAMIAEGSTALIGAAARANVSIQKAPGEALRMNLPERWRQIDIQLASVPVLFAHTPVETVDARDVDALAALVAASVGLPMGAPVAGAAGAASAAGAAGAASAAGDASAAGAGGDQVLRSLIETYGVSGHEAPVRDQVLAHMPAWAKPQVDDRGNVIVNFGRGGKSLIFVAHLDEVGFEITGTNADGTATVRTRGGMYLSVYEAHPVIVTTPNGQIAGILTPRAGYTTAKEAQPEVEQLSVYFGTTSSAETSALGVSVGQSATVRKQFVTLGNHRATGRSMDDRNGSTALLLALQQIDPAHVNNQVTFAWSVEEETGLTGATHMASGMQPEAAFAIDTFVSTDTPVDIQRLAGAKLGRGAVLRVLDSRTIVPPHIVDRIVGIARADKVPLQLGVTSGGTDAAAFSAGGAVDLGLSWPGRYSHSPVEIMDRRDLDALVRLIVAIARNY